MDRFFHTVQYFFLEGVKILHPKIGEFDQMGKIMKGSSTLAMVLAESRNF